MDTFSIFSSSSNFYSFLNLSLNVGKILNILKNSNDFIQFKVTRQGFLNIYFVKSLSPRNNGQFYLVSAQLSLCMQKNITRYQSILVYSHILTVLTPFPFHVVRPPLPLPLLPPCSVKQTMSLPSKTSFCLFNNIVKQ